MVFGAKRKVLDALSLQEEKVRVGVVGVGYLGKYHAMKYSSIPQANLVGVVDIDKERAVSLGKELKTSAYYHYSELFNKVEAVSIAVPTNEHCSIALEFINRGVAVLIEKPITETLEQADELIEAAERRGVVLQVGHLERFNSAIMALEGNIDTPMFIESHRLAPFKERSTDIDVILDLMIHDIDIILSLVGSEVTGIESVGVPVISDKVDIANARITFKGGCVANVTSSRVTIKQTRKIRIFQHDAYISLDYARQKIALYRRIKEEGLKRPKIEYENVKVKKKMPLKRS